MNSSSGPARAPERYAHYALGVLVLVYVFLFVDRQILSILNDEIKRDLGLRDAQMGFLYGTAFAVFYALFGIPLGRLADVWVRRSLIAASLAVWSAMTALSGLARSFAELAAARIGVGIGEAGASPAAFALLSDYYPPARRATALSLYSSGIYIGAGLGLMIGGQIVHRWDAAFPGGSAPFGVRGWQVAFFAVGLPGLLLALWVRSLREPVRGAMDVGAPAARDPSPRPFREFARELGAVIPPFGLIHLARIGGGARRIGANLAALAGIALAGSALARATGDTAQWSALGVGLYAATSWAQSLALRDPPAAAVILHTRSLRWTAIGVALLAFTGYGVGYWVTPFFLRVHRLPIERAGFALGGTAAAAGWLGIALGGLLGDAWRRRDPRGRLFVAMVAAALPLPVLPWLLTTASTSLALALNFPLAAAGSMWIGVGAATIQDLVLPRMRGTATAAYLLVVTFIGLAMGPYTMGRLSDLLGDVRPALGLGLLANAGALACLWWASRWLAADKNRCSHAPMPPASPGAKSARNFGRSLPGQPRFPCSAGGASTMLGRRGGSLLQGVGEGFELSLRALALPWMLGLRWAGRVGAPPREGVPPSSRSLSLALKVAADELFFATELVSGALQVGRSDRRRLARELEAAHELFEGRGWLARPETFHERPPPLAEVALRDTRVGRRRYRHLSFASGFAPREGVPGRSRWLRYGPNRTAHAWVLRHEGAPRPWVVCVPGFRMGQPSIDFAGFRAGWLHEELGLNVAIAVLPFHGPRRVGRRSGDGYLSGDFVDTLHAQAQAVWDLRRLVGWLRRGGAPAVGAYGVSLGAYTVSLLAALEPGLDCVVAGIPASCFVGLARTNVPPGLLRLAELLGFPFARIEALLRVVSPLALRPSVARERCFIYAATADRLAPPAQAYDLWEHWGQPRVSWYQGSHVSFVFEPAVRALLREALGPDGMLRARAAERRPRFRAAGISAGSLRRVPPSRGRAAPSPLPRP